MMFPSVRRFLQNLTSELIDKIIQPATLLWAPAVFLILGLSLALAYFLIIGIEGGMFAREFCFTLQCVDDARKAFSPVYDIVSSLFAGLVAIVTVLAAFTAVNTYQLSVKSNVLGNHIAHFDMFRSYVEGELPKLPRLDKKTVDVFKLFGFIFPQSRDGDFFPCDEYAEFVDEIGGVIRHSADKYSGKNSEVFYSFKEHQARVRTLMAKCGIELAIKPSQTDFFKMEREVYELLRRVNQCFCAARKLSDIPTPSYS